MIQERRRLVQRAEDLQGSTRRAGSVLQYGTQGAEELDVGDVSMTLTLGAKESKVAQSASGHRKTCLRLDGIQKRCFLSQTRVETMAKTQLKLALDFRALDDPKRLQYTSCIR